MRRRLILIAATWAAGVGLVAGSAHAQAPTPPDGRFFLVGVVMVEGGREQAWIQEPNFTGNNVVTVRLGDRVGPYHVTKILTHQVELTGPGGTVSVPLAGVPGAVSVASRAGTVQQSAGELPPIPARQNSQAGRLEGGNPRRNFPTAQISRGPSRARQPKEGSQPRAASAQGVPDPAAVPALAPELPPTLALQNSQVRGRGPGNPSKYFPTDKMFGGPGQGSQLK